MGQRGFMAGWSCAPNGKDSVGGGWADFAVGFGFWISHKVDA
jgi:hypothetical protein